ncbi:MAG: alpha/beta hydrolase [Pedosphaera sp.]|nr:alpha/beta hydrolase [Pedosphaera sp.]
MNLASLLFAGIIAFTTFVRAADTPKDYTRTEDVVYGRKFGTALTLDVFQPSKQNGAAVLFMVSGGFFSSHEAINVSMYKPFLDRGYTIFAIVHGSQPRFIIPEITQDIHRALRFVRYNAGKWGVNPDKFGITGASAGGHLSLIMGTQGGPGKADAKDPIDRQSSAVQAVACFFPPADFLNWGREGDDAVGIGTLANFQPAFGVRSASAESRQVYGKEISPIYFVNSAMPPTLIIHGDADKLVPIYQAEMFVKRAKEAGAPPVSLIVKPGKDHGWPDIIKDLDILAEWFDEHLRGIKPASNSKEK